MLALAPLVVVVLAAMHPSGALLSGVGLPDSLSLATFRDGLERRATSTS